MKRLKCTLGAVRDPDAIAVLHHCDKAGNLEFLCGFLVFILGTEVGKLQYSTVNL